MKQPASAHIGSQHGSEPPPSTTYPGSRTTFQSRARSSNTRSRSAPEAVVFTAVHETAVNDAILGFDSKVPRIRDEPRWGQRTPIRMLDDALHQQRHANAGNARHSLARNASRSDLAPNMPGCRSLSNAPVIRFRYQDNTDSAFRKGPAA